MKAAWSTARTGQGRGAGWQGGGMEGRWGGREGRQAARRRAFREQGASEKGGSQLVLPSCAPNKRVSWDLVSGSPEESRAGGTQSPQEGAPLGRGQAWGRAPCSRDTGSPFWSLSQKVLVSGSWPSGSPQGVGPALGAAPGVEQRQSSSVGRSRSWGYTGVAGGPSLVAASSRNSRQLSPDILQEFVKLQAGDL